MVKVSIIFTNSQGTYMERELEADALFIRIADLLLSEFKGCQWHFKDPILEGIMSKHG